MSAPAKRSSTDTQEKDLMLDKDMEKDTWDFKSLTDDDPMDFGFEPIAKNKKNAFKLDMGFDLDGDFGNLSSFKMDMPYFDFSSPSKKTTKTKESSDDKTSGSNKQKKDLFAFSYDFNALDDFDLDPSPPKKGSETKTNTMDHEETAAGRKNDKLDALDFDFDSSPPKKKGSETKTKTMDREEIAPGRKTDKSDALDFDLDSSPPKKKGSETKTKTMDREEIPPGRKTDKSDALDFDLDSSPPKKKGSETKTKTMDREEIAPGRKTDKSDALDFDLDSSPPKKKGSETKTKTMDREEIAPGRKTDKSDALDFDLDSSSPKKGSETKTKTMNCEKIAAGRKIDKADAMDFGLDLQAASKAKTVVKVNASAEIGKQISNTTETLVADNSTHSKQATLESIENSEAVESPQSPRLNRVKTQMMCLQPQPVNTSLSKTSCPMVEELDEPCSSNETIAPSPLHASETAHTAVSRETSPNVHETCGSGTKEDSPRDPDQNAYSKMISTTESSYEKTEPNISSQLCLDKTEHQQEEMGRDTQAEIQDQTRRTLCDPDTGHSQKNLSGKISPGTRPSQTAKVQDSNAKLPLAPSHSIRDTDTQAEIMDQTGRTLCDPNAGYSQTNLPGKVSAETRRSQTIQIQDSSAKLPLAPSHSVLGPSDLKAMQNKDSGLIRSRFFKKPEQPESHVLESSPSRTESRRVTRESPGNKDALPGSKARRFPLEPVNMNSEKNAENVNTSSSHEKMIIHKDPVEPVAGLMDRSKMQAKNTTRERSILQINISSKLDASSLTQKLSKHLSSGAESLQKSKIVPLERPKLGNITADLRAAKTQRTIGVSKDQPSSAVQPEVSSSISKERTTETPVFSDMRAAKTQRTIGRNKDQPTSAVQPEVSSSISMERNTETRVKQSFEIHHLAPRDKTQILHYPSSLKRKAPDEDLDRSLTPQLKRFSMSPRENRNLEERTHRGVAQGKFPSQESRITKELVNDSPRVKSHHQIINMANLEIPITENNDNVEKAEAYTKELENICNILKKKHEEAKELLVRAVVNNNKLLMLNHPLHDHKIRMIQEFAEKLTLEEHQMMET